MGFVLSLLLFAATLLLSEILRPAPDIENARPAGLGDFDFPTATEERPIPVVWGTVRVKGPNVIWYGDLVQEPITEKIKTGLFSSKRVTKGYRYYIGIQMAICRGTGFPDDSSEEVRLLRVWVGEEEVFNGTQGEGSFDINEPELFGGDDLGRGGLVGTVSVRVGSESQILPTYLQPFQQAPSGASPNYRGTMFVTLERGYIGNSTRVDPWSFEVRRIPNPLGLATPTVNSGDDLNPMNAIYELITNDEWGLGYATTTIDEDRFTEAAETLRSEGNGLSFNWDRQRPAAEMLREIERQIDGVVFFNRSTGLWDINLVRGGYDVNLIPEVSEDDLIDVQDFTRGSWEDTTNFVQVSFKHRGREYGGTYAPAIDHGNILIRGGEIATSIISFPMVKDPDLASQIAWRELRTLSFPLAKARLVVDRKFYGTNPGDVIAWTDADLGYDKLPVRVTRVDLGSLASGEIALDVVQDVFTFESPSFAAPSIGEWVVPTNTMVAIPADESVVIEAPRAFLTRDPFVSEPDATRLWVGARNQSDGAVAINVLERHAAGTPSGTFALGGEVFGFIQVGELASSLGRGSTDGVSNATVDLVADPSSQAAILSASDDVGAEGVGVNLTNIALVGDELIGFESAAADGMGVELSTVYRGLMDTAQAEHAAGTPVYLLSAGGNLTDSVFPAGQNVDVKLQTKSTTDVLAEGDAPTIAVDLDLRARRPYLPSRLDLNGSYWPSSVDLDDTDPGSGLDEVGIRVTLTRRSYETTNEVAALTTDAGSSSPDHLIDVVEDPDGSPTTIISVPAFSGQVSDLSRTSILAANGGTVPSRLQLRVTSRHVDGGDTLDSLDTLDFSFDSTSDLDGLAELGVLDTNDVSASFAAAETGTYDFEIGTALPGGDVEARLNGGSWVVVIAQGNTTGTLAVTASDDVEVRHTDATGGIETLVLVTAPSSADEAFGVLAT